MLIDPYAADKKFQNFPELDDALAKYYDRYILDLNESSSIATMTPRYQLEHGLRIGFRDIFYYIDRLYDNDPGSVIDVGCGECIWKKWFPKIQGFDPFPSPYADCDFVDHFDQDFSAGHQENWDSGMALNSIHFVSWTEIEKQISRAMNIIRSGGRFLFTFNFNMLDKHTQNTVQIQNKSLLEKIRFMDQIVNNSGFDIVLKDYPTLRGVSDHAINSFSHLHGHVRFILQK